MVERRPQAQITPEGSPVSDVERRIGSADGRDGDGRLNEQEFDERAERASRAQARRDLTGLSLDMDDQDTSSAPGRLLVRHRRGP